MARGISTGADIIKVTVDGRDLTRQVWKEFQDSLRLKNEDRDNFLALLGFKTTAAGDSIAQTTNVDDFEKASEFGVPKSLRAPGDYLTLGFNFDWFDAATRYTWRFLADADASQVEAIHAAALEADNRLVFKACFGRLLNNVATTNPEGLPVYPLYNADGTVPPEYAAVTFSGSHTHYLVSGAATVDGNDVVELTRHVAHHGYGDAARGARVIVFCHPNEAELLRGVAKGATSSVDFINSESAPAFLTTQTLVGQRPPSSLGRIPIFGSLGAAWLSENALIPPGYLVAVAVGGANASSNVLAIREHTRAELRGLRQIPVSAAEPTVQDSYYSRGFGTGVRLRGAAAVMQVKASGTYDIPSDYTTVLA